MPSKSRKKILHERQNGKCFYCGDKTIISKFSVDHFVPKALGGKDTWSNLVGSCKECNNKKGMKSVDYFEKEIPQIKADRDIKYLEKAFVKLDNLVLKTTNNLKYAYEIVFS